MRIRTRSMLTAAVVAVLVAPLMTVLSVRPAVAAGPQGQTTARIIGEVERLGLNNPADPFSAGTMVVGGQLVTLPRNLLYDLPANRLSLPQLFAQAPAQCRALKQSGLSKADACNLSGTGAIATVEANRTAGGNVIAGDVFLQKGVETLNGTVTYIDFTNGFYRLNGNTGDPTTGVMVRLNDPTSRHTMQQGPGCQPGSRNCSADPRFALDPDNYTNAFASGYPLCLPSAIPRTFLDVLDLNTNGNTTETLTSQSDLSGHGDLLCPDANRSAPVDPQLGQQALDSRRFAPVQVGDSVTALGNFETIGGVRFLSAHTTKVSRSVTTRSASDPTQPDYVILNSMFIDAPGFFRERARDLFLGATTAVDSDVAIWTVHRDPATNAAHEFPLGSVVGCENAAGALACRRVLGPNTFRIRHDVDFAVGASPSLNPCIQINADPRFAGKGICQGRNNDIGEMFAMMSPIPREVQLRTGVEMADLARPGGPLLKAIDINGVPATHGQYLFPMGVGLGGVEFPAFAEINLNLLNNPGSISGLPWALDRRLSPNGCPATGCEATAQPLDPFPFEGFDPRQPGAGTPQGNYTDPNYTASLLTNERDRMLSFVDPTLGNFNGDSTVLAWPPIDPPGQPILPTPALNGTNTAPIAADDAATVPTNSQANNIDVLANDLPGGTPFNFASVTVSGGPTHGSVTANTTDGVLTYTPAAGFTGTDSWQYTVRNAGGLTSNAATVTVTVSPPPAPAPTITALSPVFAQVGQPVTITGTNLNFVQTVSYPTAGGGTTLVAASQFSAQPADGLSLVVNVPPGAVNGPITVSSTGGPTATSSASLTVTAAPPTITSISPSAGAVGDSVTVHGSNLNGAVLAFNGISQPVVVTTSPSQLSAVVPVGATTGKVTVTTTGGVASSATDFTVLTAPTQLRQITTVTPSAGPVGQLVQVDGTGFDGLSRVTFNGVPTAFTPVDSTRFFTSVPNGASSGRLVVTVGPSVAPVVLLSPASFTVTTPIQPPPATVPAAPGVRSATAGNTTATLSWTTPADGGAALTGYLLQATPAAGNPTVTATAAPGANRATITGLRNNIRYTLRVRAQNSAGPGLFSAASPPVTPGLVPGAPTAVKAAARPGTVPAIVVSWIRPAHRGTSPLTRYVITAITTNRTLIRTRTVAADLHSLAFTGLVKNVAYQFTVAAVNATGAGPSSARSRPVIAP